METKQRRYGTGGVTLRGDGRWMASIPLPKGDDGRRRRKTVYGKTEAEAHAKLEMLVTEFGLTPPPPSPAWIKRRAAMERGTHTEEEWVAKLAAANGHCFYCDEVAPLEMDHLTPMSREGSDAIDNLVPSCHPCNLEKHCRTLDEYLDWKATGVFTFAGENSGCRHCMSKSGRLVTA